MPLNLSEGVEDLFQIVTHEVDAVFQGVDAVAVEGPRLTLRCGCRRRRGGLGFEDGDFLGAGRDFCGFFRVSS